MDVGLGDMIRMWGRLLLSREPHPLAKEERVWPFGCIAAVPAQRTAQLAAGPGMAKVVQATDCSSDGDVHDRLLSPPPLGRHKDLSRPTQSSPGSGSLDDILESIGYGPFQALAFLFAGLASFAFAFDIIVFEFIDISVQDQWNLSSVNFAILPSMTCISNIPGAMMYGYLADTFGRVWPMALALANVAVFTLASAFSPNYIALIFLRVASSFGVVGVTTLIFPILIEFLPVRNRGKVLTSVFLVQLVGYCTCGGLAWWLIPHDPRNGWRYLIIASSIPVFIAALFRLVFYVESPRYLVAQGKFSEAKKVLAQIARINRKSSLIEVIDSSDLKPNIDRKSLTTVIFQLRILFGREYLKRTLCLIIIYVIETGSYYASSIFLPETIKNLNTDLDPYFVAFISLLGPIPGVILMSIIMEWPGVGRINSLRLFTLLCVVFFVLLAVVQNSISVPVIVILIYFSMVPIIPLLFTYISECYPTEIRATASGIFNICSAFVGISFLFLGGFLAGSGIPWLFPAVFACVFVVQFVTSLFLRYETLGMKLKDTILD